MLAIPLLLLLASSCIDAYKILVYNSKFGHSHSNYMGRLADIIAAAGHEVCTDVWFSNSMFSLLTSLVPTIDPGIHDGSHNSTKIVVEQGQATKELFSGFADAQKNLFATSIFDPIGGYMFGHFFGATFAAQCRTTLEQPGLIERLKAENYDVMLAEPFDMCGYGLVEVLKPRAFIPVATSVAYGPLFDEFGIPNMPSFDPSVLMSSLNVHSMWDRLWNLYSEWLIRFQFNLIRTHMHNVFTEKFGPNFPSFLEISSRSAYVFTNCEPLIDFATPTITKVINLGGLGAKQPKKLSEEWESILARREKTILLSFGSVVKSFNIAGELKMAIVETIKAFPNVTFIWKYEKDDDFTKDIASKVDNLVLSKWMPQNDLLAHPKLAAFITHGGAGSTHEAARRGVPGIFVPLFGDQPRNAGMMQHNGLGRVMNKYDIDKPAKLIAVIREVLENDSYRKNAQRVAAMLKKKPFNASELIVKYVEFAAEFGPSAALRPQSYDMSWIEYHNVDIVIVAIFVVAAVSVLTSLGSFYVGRLLLARAHKTKSD